MKKNIIKSKKKVLNMTFNLVMFLLSIIFLAPIWLILTNSLKPQKDANLLGIGFPGKIIWENYKIVFIEGDILQAFLNGVLISSLTVFFVILFSSTAAFVIARRNTKLTEAVYHIFVAGLIFPGALIPTYWVLHNLRLINTYPGIILVYVTIGIPMSVFLYTGFIKMVPREMDEAAIVDGAGKVRLFFQIVFPLIKAVTMTVLIFHFLGVWNEAKNQMYFVGSDKWTLPMTVYRFYGKYSYQWNLVFADVTMCILPVLILYLCAQKYVVSGLTAGAVKG